MLRKNWIVLAILLFGCSLGAQNRVQVNWISFEVLADSLRAKPRKVFIDIYTDWCVYCRKMDKQVFTNPRVAAKLNNDYYAVRLDAETLDTIRFDGQAFINRQAETQRRGFHELALLLGQRDGQFAPPVIVILDAQFRLSQRYFQYLHSAQLLEILD